jgi:hypothetical protein
MSNAMVARRQRAIARVVEQEKWIEECGGGLSGYIEHYGHSTDPEHYGDGAEAIYAADQAALDAAMNEALDAIRETRT